MIISRDWPKATLQLLKQLIPFHFLLKDSRFRRFSNVKKMDDSRSIQTRLTPGLMIKPGTSSINQYICVQLNQKEPINLQSFLTEEPVFWIKVNYELTSQKSFIESLSE